MNNYYLLKRSSIALACVIALLVSSAAPAAKLMFADSFPPSNTLAKEGVVWWMHKVEELTDNDITFNYFPNEQLAKADKILQKIQDGVIQAGYIGIGYVSDSMPLNGATMLPGEVSDVVEASHAYWDALKSDTVLRQEFLDNGVVPLYAVLLPPYQAILNSEPLQSIADLEGLKLRSSGSLNMVVEAVGASPVSMAAPDTYLAIQRGTLDGALFPVTSISSYRLDEVIESISTNASFGSFAITVAMDKSTYDGLSDAQKKALMQAGDDTVDHLSHELEKEVSSDLEQFREEGVETYQFPESLQQALM